jgi:hypothetical protein
MQTWLNPSKTEIKQYQAIEIILKNHEKLIDFIFDKINPRLKWPTEKLLKNAKGFSNSEYILIKIVLDIWNGTGNAYLNEVLESVDNDNFVKIMKGLIYLKLQK